MVEVNDCIIPDCQTDPRWAVFDKYGTKMGACLGHLTTVCMLCFDAAPLTLEPTQGTGWVTALAGRNRMGSDG